MRILAIDPGLRCTGVAAHHPSEGWAVFSICPKAHDLMSRVREVASALERRGPWDLVVIEKPQVYRQGLQKGDPNDLIDLAVLVGALVASVDKSARILLPRPCEWKGQVPKHIHHERIRARVPLICDVSRDAMDALGLALWAMEH